MRSRPHARIRRHWVHEREFRGRQFVQLGRGRILQSKRLPSPRADEPRELDLLYYDPTSGTLLSVLPGSGFNSSAYGCSIHSTSCRGTAFKCPDWPTSVSHLPGRP